MKFKSQFIIIFFKGYGEYFFNDTPFSCEEAFPDLARGEMSKKKLEKGEGLLSINYTGSYCDDLTGFYKAEYNHGLAKEPYSLTTQFQVMIFFILKGCIVNYYF